MKASKRLVLFEKDSDIIRSIAERYNRKSSEYAALKRATIALSFAITEGHDAFIRCVGKIDEDLTL